MPLAGTTAAPKKKNKGPLIAVIVLLLALIGGIGYLLVTQLGDNGSAATIPVPDVVGQPVAEARLHLAAVKLTKVTVVRRANDQFAPGLVVRQDPSSGTKVAPDESILLTVSDGAGNVKVPDVVGEAFEDAANALQAKGLNAVRADNASDSVPLGQVISTNPPADKTVKRNSDVQVSVSAGPAPVNVPNVEGKDQVEAAQILTDAGLKFQKTNMASSGVPAGSVISTNPAAGTQAPRNSTVTMNVSTGPEQVTVPNVVGKTQADAYEHADRRGVRRPGRAGAVLRVEHGQGDHPGAARRHHREQGDAGDDHRRHRPRHDHHLHDVTRPAALAGWYREHGRHELAWRATRDRWSILVSEVMLQQTQVPRVATAWPGFIGRFPDPAAMAMAGPGAVIIAWGTARLPAPGPPALGGCEHHRDRRLAGGPD